MRTLEILLLSLNFLTFFGLLMPHRFAVSRLAQLAPVAMLVAGAQGLLEGSRWQMFSAYALTGFFFVLWWLRKSKQRIQIVRQNREHRVCAALGAALGVLGLALSIALPNSFPVFRFLPPSGPYAIGTRSYAWTDYSRAEIFNAEQKRYRTLMVQIWYPAVADASAPRAPYMPDADAVTSAVARIHHLPEWLFEQFRFAASNATLSAPLAQSSNKFPVLLFLEGVTGFRQMNTYQVEHLVSHGYVVVALDQPGSAAAVVFPDGRQIDGLTLDQIHPLIDQSLAGDTGHARAPVLHARAIDELSIVPYLAQDISFVLDQLEVLNADDSSEIFRARLDMPQIGAFGVSLGGIVLGEACQRDPRLRACLVMDAPMSINVVRLGLRQPSMWITRDAATMRLERQRAGGWSEGEIEMLQRSMRAAYQSLPEAAYLVRVEGLFHSNLTDLPIWFPYSSLLGVSGPIDSQRAHEIVNSYSRAFFDRHLLGRPAALLDDRHITYREVSFESH